MTDESRWEAKAKGLLKAELKRRGIAYQQLTNMLTAMGIQESEPNVRNKIARGKFSAVFLLQCMEAIGVHTLRLSDD